ncbi:uncharacterized protein AB675_3628 [Cyphellophora attinorum]|uniref:Uncharacterized protein n=1 Tax=Cyphellophora attinorum TaxID=1664694 RepID=A0A0N1NYN4_9EURO|nr:uncharacterized protein AB675_3628 [Phialophora attinorum]KPI37015.1 hypothetical protein AB675_3628 [Phialophora attinorum]
MAFQQLPPTPESSQNIPIDYGWTATVAFPPAGHTYHPNQLEPYQQPQSQPYLQLHTPADTPLEPASPTTTTAAPATRRPRPRPKPGRIIHVGAVDGFPPRNAPIPTNLSCADICRQFPNSLYNETLDAFLQHNFSSTQMYELLPDAVKQAMRANHVNAKNPANAIAKRLVKRRQRHGKRGVLDELLEGPKQREHGMEEGWRGNGRAGFYARDAGVFAPAEPASPPAPPPAATQQPQPQQLRPVSAPFGPPLAPLAPPTTYNNYDFNPPTYINELQEHQDAVWGVPAAPAAEPELDWEAMLGRYGSQFGEAEGENWGW